MRLRVRVMVIMRVMVKVVGGFRLRFLLDQDQDQDQGQDHDQNQDQDQDLNQDLDKHQDKHQDLDRSDTRQHKTRRNRIITHLMLCVRCAPFVWLHCTVCLLVAWESKRRRVN